jgi:hypothetical protein
MTMSGNALKLIQRSLGDLRVCKNMLVVPPTERYLRCFMFERTLGKGLFYFWGVIKPLYSPIPVITLGYSRRLANSDYIDLGDLEFEASVRRLTDIISHGELQFLESIRGPAEFLENFGGDSRHEGVTPRIFAIEAALTYYLLGNIPFCLDILDEYVSQDMGIGAVKTHLEARDLARGIRNDPSAGHRFIDRYQSENIKRFGLARTVANKRPG